MNSIAQSRSGPSSRNPSMAPSASSGGLLIKSTSKTVPQAPSSEKELAILEKEFDFDSDFSDQDGFGSDDEYHPRFSSDDEYHPQRDDNPTQKTQVTPPMHGVPCRCQVNEFGPVNLSNVVNLCSKTDRLIIYNEEDNKDIDPGLFTTVQGERVPKTSTFLNIEKWQAYRKRIRTYFGNNTINVFTKDKKCFSISDYTLGNDTNGTAILSFKTEAGEKTLTNEDIDFISIEGPNLLGLCYDSKGDNVYISYRKENELWIWDEDPYLKVEPLTKFPASLRPTYAFPTDLSLNLPSVGPLPLPSSKGTIQSLNPVYIVAETIITEQSRGEIKGPLTLSWQSPSEGEDWRLEIKNDDGFEGDMTWKRENAQDTSSFKHNAGMTLNDLNRLAIIQALGATIQEIPFKRLDDQTQNAVRRLSLTMAIDRDSKKASPITNLDCDVENLLTQTLLERTRT